MSYPRKKIVEASALMRNDRMDKPKWRVIDTIVKGDAAVEVSELPLRIPRYSFRVGSAKFDERNHTVSVGPRLTVFNVLEAAELLQTIGETYVSLREDKIEEAERVKAELQNKYSVDEYEEDE